LHLGVTRRDDPGAREIDEAVGAARLGGCNRGDGEAAVEVDVVLAVLDLDVRATLEVAGASANFGETTTAPLRSAKP
jgi:hypothetical protein